MATEDLPTDAPQGTTIESHRAARLDFGGPARYRIVVQGTVAPSFVGRLGDMTVASLDREGGFPRTTLSGEVRDQAELNGILETLYGLHLPILSVQRTTD